MLISEYSYETDIKVQRREAYNEGMTRGIEEGIQKGLQEGIQKGIEEGQEKSKVETARNLLEKKIDISIISECTGLSLEKLEEIAKRIGKS